MDFIEEIKKNVNGRSIVIWGISGMALKCYYVLQHNKLSPLMLMSDRCKETPVIKGIEVNGRKVLDKNKVFVIALNKKVVVDVLRSKGFEEHKDFIVKTDGFLKYDCLWDGVFVGRFTTQSNTFANCLGIHSRHNCISSIGRYCVFNERAYMNGNHQSTGMTMSQYFMRYVDSIANPNETKNLNDYLEPYNRITIGNDVWIGAGAFINTSKVKSIGDGAIIGANAVINEDVPPYAVVLGTPGRVKKYRFEEKQIETLLRVQWWNWDDEMIKKNADCFKDVNLFFERFS
ncbi:MAG: CatB-related O-acetyltransferase [Eggerthellaceae bacterium]|nr:CatB-related O-acetyltransferase [Eggerthellaceae bacterium]